MTPLKVPPTPDLVTVTVDGQERKLPKGKNLLQALLDDGVYVPHYCYHPALSIAGNCRLCLVEIEGRPKPEVSCNMVVTDGLKIKVNSQLAEDCRKGMMEFLLVNHPLDCPICDRGGECMLQRYSMDYGWGTARTVDARRRFPKPQFDPLIDIERNRCIMCTRCVRFSDEVAGEHVMGVFGHGNRNYIGTFGNGPVGNPFSGNVIDLCPVGCLTAKPYRFKARPWELRQTLTTTRACNGAVTAWTRGERLYRVTPPVRRRRGYFTLNEDTTEFISNEARFGTMYASNPERFVEPRVNTRPGDGAAGVPDRASWDVALGAAVAALRAAKSEEVCVLAGERGTNEEFFLLARLARTIIGTPYIDWRSRYVSPEAAEAVGTALAAGNADYDVLDKKGYGATLLINADELLGSAPDIALRLREAVRLGRTKLGLLGPRVEPWFAAQARVAYLERPEELAGVIDKLADALKKGPDAANAPRGYETLFKFLTANEQGMIGLGLDTAGGALAPALVPPVLRLMDALGPNWHFLPLTAARNAKGAFACGAQGDRLPGGSFISEDSRQRLEAIWEEPIKASATPATPPASGMNGPALLRLAAQGKFKVLILHRCDELVTHPQRELIEAALKNTPTVITIDLFPSWVTERAAIVLPGALFFETDGSMTDIDGTLQRMSMGVRPTGQAQEDWRIITSLSDRLGAIKNYRQAGEVFADLIKAWQAPAPFRLDDLTLQGPGEETPQRPHVFFGQRTRPTFKLNFTERTELPSPTAPAASKRGDGLSLLWIHHSQGEDHLTSHSTEFSALRPRPKIELNPADAKKLGVAEGDWVSLEGGAGSPTQVIVNAALAEGAAFGAANVLGLRLTQNDTTVPVIRLKKTAPPAHQPADRTVFERAREEAPVAQ